MKYRYCIILAALYVLCSISPLHAANEDVRTVTLEVQAINEIRLSGSPSALTVSTAVAGQEPTVVQNTSTTYRITINGSNKKITGSIDTSTETGITLQVNLTAPAGASSLGNVTLTPTAADLVTGISKRVATNLRITYRLSATVDAGVIATTTRTVTFTIADG